MIIRRTILSFIIMILASLTNVPFAQAGFGIQPPYVKPSKAVFAGTRYEQKINLLRSSADADMKAVISVTAPEISPWISIDKGLEFDLPRDELRVPMVVLVDVPEDAAIGNYKGHLNVKIEPKEKSQSNGVAIALGARVEIDLTVTDESFLDFIVRKVDVPAIEQLKSPWNWKIFSYFFYRVKAKMLIENTGNTKISPSKVQVEFYDNAKEKRLESHTDRSIAKIDPFLTQEVEASFPTDLPPGEYWAKLSIYKDKEILQKNEIIFTIFENGKSPNPVPLGKWPYIMMAGLVALALIGLWILYKIRIWRHLGKIIWVLIWPLRFILRKIGNMFGSMKRRFWKWMHVKASRYQDDDRKRR